MPQPTTMRPVQLGEVRSRVQPQAVGGHVVERAGIERTTAALANTPSAAYATQSSRRVGNGRLKLTAIAPISSPAVRNRPTRNHKGGIAVAPILLGTYAEAHRRT